MKRYLITGSLNKKLPKWQHFYFDYSYYLNKIVSYRVNNMGNIKFENLDDSPIDFELSEEDLKSIKGGITSLDYKIDEYDKIEDFKRKDVNIEDFKIKDFKIEDRIIKDFKIDIIIKIECYRCNGDDPWLLGPLV